jgi:DNA-directed RNA polymerase specialized sigma24 family protein
MDETMIAVSNSVGSNDNSRLADPALLRSIERFVQRRVPAVEVDDVVQTVLCDALAAAEVPEDDEQLRKWLFGITRHKVADFHRRGGRNEQVELPEDLEGPDAPHSAREWAQWAEKQTEGKPDEQRTLDWMAREGAGEKLAHIAEDEDLPAPQVRQRVSRMRRIMRQRWAMELAAVAAVLIVALIAWRLLREPQPTAEDLTPVPEVVPGPKIAEGRKLRADALRQCEAEQWQRCIDGLDAAAKLDPKGDGSEAVKAARSSARKAFDEAEEQTPTDTAPTASVSNTPPPAPPVKPVNKVKPQRKKAPPTKKRPIKPSPNVSQKKTKKNAKSDSWLDFQDPPQQAPPQQQKLPPPVEQQQQLKKKK